MHRLMVALSVAGVLAVCAATSTARTKFGEKLARNDAKLSAELHGLKPSSPHTCIDSYRLRNATAEPYGNTILYRVGPGLVYRNDTSGGCVGLNRGQTLLDKFYAGGARPGQMCSGDLLYSGDVHARTVSGSCKRGAWVAYTK